VHVTVIAKEPVPGRVKTRLCPPCTPAQAAELAAAALADTVEAIDAALATAGLLPSVRRVLLVDGRPPPWLPDAYEVVAQSGGDLGMRLAHGFDQLGPGIIVGMETPHAIPALVTAIGHIAAGTDVIGPALDGGYWSIGLARVEPGIFDGVPMSTTTTGDAQLRRLRQMGHAVAALPVARDIDVFDDVRSLAASVGGGRAVDVARRLVVDVDRLLSTR
jgi:uncharacterized protein